MSQSNLSTNDSDNHTTERGVPVSRIRIDELPIAENLTPEQEALIQGAGLKSFRPSIEALEDRFMPAFIGTGIDLTGTTLTIFSSGTPRPGTTDSPLTNSATIWTNSANQVVAQRGNQPAVFLDRSQVTNIVYQGQAGIDIFRNNTDIPSSFPNRDVFDTHTVGANQAPITQDAGFQLTSNHPGGLPESSASGRTVVGGQLLTEVRVGDQRLGDVEVGVGQRLGDMMVGNQRLGEVVVGGQRLGDVRLESGLRLRDVVGVGQRLGDMEVGDRRLGTDQRLDEVVVGGQRIGQNLHPPVTLKNVLIGTRSLVLIMKDRLPGGDYTHSVLYNIPQNTREIRGTADGGVEGIDRIGTRTFYLAPPTGGVPSSDGATGTQQGVDDDNRAGYQGPNPRDGLRHNYVWTLYALSTDRVQLPEGARGTAAQLEAAIQPHIIGQTSIQNTFQYRPGIL
jgi:Raf kinase inhibitor-like YbhB/YbcL family protein